MPYVVGTIILGALGVVWFYLFDYFKKLPERKEKDKRRRERRRERLKELGNRIPYYIPSAKARHVMIEFSPNEKDAWEAAVNFRDVDDWYVSKLRSSGQWARKGVKPGWRITNVNGFTVNIKNKDEIRKILKLAGACAIVFDINPPINAVSTISSAGKEKSTRKSLPREVKLRRRVAAKKAASDSGFFSRKKRSDREAAEGGGAEELFTNVLIQEDSEVSTQSNIDAGETGV